MEELNLNITQRIKEIMEIEGLKNEYDLAKKTGVGKPTLRDILTGRNKYPRTDTLYRIVSGLGITLEDFFKPVENEPENRAKQYKMQIIKNELNKMDEDNLEIIKTMVQKINEKKNKSL